MTDKEIFRKEVEKLKSNLIHGACSSQVAMETRCKEEAYNEVLAILDTMQEQHKETNFLDELKTKLDSMSKEEFKKVFDKYAIDFNEELVSEDFENALAQEWKAYNDRGAATVDALEDNTQELAFAKGFYRGANWQMEQDQSTIELAEDHSYFAGRTKTIEEIEEKLLSEVLPCFMHGGEADEVVAKLDEVLNQKQ